MLEEGLLPRDGKYKQIVVRLIELSRSRFSRFLGTVSKLNRDPRFIKDLMSYGEVRAEEFLTALGFEDAWRSRDCEAVMGFFAGDAELVSSTPFPDGGVYRGKEEIHAYLQEHLGEDVRMDLTEKQLARNRVAWTARAYLDEDPADWTEGTAEAAFRGGKNREFKPLLKKAGLSGFTFHSLRHTCATLLCSKNVNPKIVQEILGHATISQTMDTYSHPMPGMGDVAATALEEALS
jgi:hypothetical protein